MSFRQVSLALAAVTACFSLSCRRNPFNLNADLPPGIVHEPGVFVDIGPRWSHDGRRIAFFRQTTDRKMQLCVASRDLTRIVPLLQPEVVSPDKPLYTRRDGLKAPYCLAWSPNDRAIGFTRAEWFTFENGDRLPGTSIWQYDLKTGEASPLATHEEEPGNFYFFRSLQYAPDGKRIAFIGESLHGETALYIRDLSAMNPQMELPRFDPDAETDWPAWSADGKRLAFRQGVLRSFMTERMETLRFASPGSSEPISATNIHADYVRAISGMQGRRGFTAARITSPVWSPDGSRVAFSLWVRTSEGESFSLWVAQVAGNRTLRRISAADGYRYQAPVWIDRHRIGAVRSAPGKGIEAVAIPSAGGQARVLCRLPSFDLDWSPDRKKIVCASDEKPRPAALTTLRVFATGL
jgi:Tol biopolymer transport system component